MDQLTYTLERKQNTGRLGRYRRAELELMTTFHLREICRKEKIIHAAMDTMDKEELVRIIMRFRGQEDCLLVRKNIPGGHRRVEEFCQNVKLVEMKHDFSVPARIMAWKGLDTNWKDGFALPYHKDIAGTNALVIGGDQRLCAILNVETVGDKLFLTRSGALECSEDITRNYAVYLLDREYSDVIYHLYFGNKSIATPMLEIHKVPILDFQIREPIQSNLPLSIDFGTSNTSAGMYIDTDFFEKVRDGIQPGQLKEAAINYVEYLVDKEKSVLFAPLIPTMVGVRSIDDDNVEYVFGREAGRLAKLSYIDESFTVFYDIKRWISDYEMVEELTDLKGNRKFVKRKDIMKAFLDYIIQEACQRFKCRFETIYMSCPVKQKKRFLDFYQEVLAGYTVDSSDILDEGVAVLYNSIAGLIDKDSYIENEKYQALIIDCGGGTTDLSSCSFSIRNLRVSYDIQIRTAYENGDTNFGGNNLTWRVMQLLKILLANLISPNTCLDRASIIASFEKDVFRFVDDEGVAPAYRLLEDEYKKAEAVIPTRFKDWEQRDRKDYYKVKSNYYFLFDTAERVKKRFFSHSDLLSITLSSDLPEKHDGILRVDKWKLSVNRKGALQVRKYFPEVMISVYEVKQVVKANIYGIIRQFLEAPYVSGDLQDYNIIKLTGQSCKIALFRDCLKEFVPGRMIQFSEPEKLRGGDYTLKLTCLDGSIRYIMDKKFGYAKVDMTQGLPNLPYILTGFTHSGQEVTLIHSLDRENTEGAISRTLESVALQLILKDVDQGEHYRYSITCDPRIFTPVTYEEIAKNYATTVPQDDVDSIINGEVKYFIWADPGYWGFVVLPILRENEQLKMGKEQFIPFENDHWVTNYFDGTR